MFDPAVLERMIEESGLSCKKTSRSFIFDCPRCGKKDKVYILRKTGQFICFYCAEIDGFKGRPEFILSELLERPIKEIRSRLYGGVSVIQNDLVKVELKDFVGEDFEPPAVIPVPDEFMPIDHELATQGVQYCDKRGLGLNICKEYGLMYNRQTKRVIFPVKKGDDWYGYQARTVIDMVPKIVSSTNLPRDRVVMFADRLEGSDHAIICEGPIDAMKAHLCGGNIATMGKIVNERQIDLILSYGVKRIYIALDPDAGEEISLLAQRLGSEVELYHMKPADGFKDLGEMTIEGVYHQFTQAERVYPTTLFLTLKA